MRTREFLGKVDSDRRVLEMRRTSRRENRRFQFKKRRQLLIRPHNETISVAAMRVPNPDCSARDERGYRK
jgi:hypothetical protein